MKYLLPILLLISLPATAGEITICVREEVALADPIITCFDGEGEPTAPEVIITGSITEPVKIITITREDK